MMIGIDYIRLWRAALAGVRDWWGRNATNKKTESMSVRAAYRVYNRNDVMTISHTVYIKSKCINAEYPNTQSVFAFSPLSAFQHIYRVIFPSIYSSSVRSEILPDCGSTPPLCMSPHLVVSDFFGLCSAGRIFRQPGLVGSPCPQVRPWLLTKAKTSSAQRRTRVSARTQVLLLIIPTYYGRSKSIHQNDLHKLLLWSCSYTSCRLFFSPSAYCQRSFTSYLLFRRSVGVSRPVSLALFCPRQPMLHGRVGCSRHANRFDASPWRPSVNRQTRFLLFAHYCPFASRIRKSPRALATQTNQLC